MRKWWSSSSSTTTTTNNNNNNNSFINIKGDLSKKFRKELKNNIECPHIIYKDVKWKYVNINPSSPTSRGLIKVYKAESPIRPFVNRTNDPTYKLARMLAKNLEIYILLPYIFKCKQHNSTNERSWHCIWKWSKIHFIWYHKYVFECSCKRIKITEIMCKQNDLNKEISDIIKICKILMKQN